MHIHELLNQRQSIVQQIKEGDGFLLEFEDLTIETSVFKVLDDGIIINGDDTALQYLQFYGSHLEESTFSDLEIAIMEGGGSLDEAEYQGRKVPLGKPMKGDVKKSKVYVRKPNGKVVKVNFGDKKLSIKKHIPGRRKNFRARHNCDNPGPRWKARYWSCRAW